ncbi:MAG: 3-deoxy-8-phosphooctulonate synthase [Pseudomonadota bacterium]|nr:3-deoxy-8-phosphooctulonate synthase [Pseudomonadota bacterium]
MRILPNNQQPMMLISGPCVLESKALGQQIAGVLCNIKQTLNIEVVFKASLIKANRTSSHSFRGVGLDQGLRWLEDIKKDYQLPVITDIHDPFMVDEVAEVVDILQIPAFLCRQTDIIESAARTKKWLLIKKGQFMAPDDMRYVCDKAIKQGNKQLLLCERGTTFGYHDLVVDLRGLVTMKKFGFPVIMDATHAVQQPGKASGASSGQRSFVPVLARAAISAGIAGIFMETHPNPKKALSDGPNAVPLHQLKQLVTELYNLDQYIKSNPPQVALFNDEEM